MHELGMAQRIAEIVKDEARRATRAPATRAPKVREITIRAGRLHAIIPESLQFHFDLLKKDDPILSEARLEVITEPLRAECLNCGWQDEQEDAIFICPKCARATEPRSGTELLVERILLFEEG